MRSGLKMKRFLIGQLAAELKDWDLIKQDLKTEEWAFASMKKDWGP